jgi:hypothetical protein
MTLVPAVSTPCNVPVDFDQEAYGRMARLASAFVDDRAYSGYASGFNGVAFRFASTDRAHEWFVEAISSKGALDPSGTRLEQEESLFAFFYNACSSLECFYYAMYNLGACLAPDAFPTATASDLRQVRLDTVADRFAKTFPDDELTRLLSAVRRSPELEGMKDHREALSHRGTAPRNHSIRVSESGIVNLGDVERATIPRNPKAVPKDWISDLALAPAMTAEPRRWLGVTHNSLFAGGIAFLTTHTR